MGLEIQVADISSQVGQLLEVHGEAPRGYFANLGQEVYGTPPSSGPLTQDPYQDFITGGSSCVPFFPRNDEQEGFGQSAELGLGGKNTRCSSSIDEFELDQQDNSERQGDAAEPCPIIQQMRQIVLDGQMDSIISGMSAFVVNGKGK